MDDSAVQAAPARAAIGAEAPRPPAPAPALPQPADNAPRPAAQAPAQRPAPAPAPQGARSSAPVSNGAKRPANGKAPDDEDWWTE